VKEINSMNSPQEKNGKTNTVHADTLFWELHDLVVAERDVLERLVRQLSEQSHKRRPYPEIAPKYFNPDNPDETWCGRGLQPRWLKARLQAGAALSDFLINPPSE
jgi:DNA-binding protein H-NS